MKIAWRRTEMLCGKIFQGLRGCNIMFFGDPTSDLHEVTNESTSGVTNNEAVGH